MYVFRLGSIIKFIMEEVRIDGQVILLSGPADLQNHHLIGAGG